MDIGSAPTAAAGSPVPPAIADRARAAWWDALTALESTPDLLKARWPRGWAALRNCVGSVYTPPQAAFMGLSRADIPYGTVVDCEGVRLHLHPDLSLKNAWRIMSGAHTRSERRLLMGALQPDDVVMELGGGIGMVSIACAQRIGSERVFAYEANPALEPLIRENYRLNGVSPTVAMCMLGRTAGRARFFVAPSFSDSSAVAGDRASTEIEVPIRPFDEEARRIRPTVLVVDIEGGEGDLLTHAELGTVRTLMVELHPKLIGLGPTLALKRTLRARGFAEVGRAGRCFLYRRRAGRGLKPPNRRRAARRS